MRGGKKTKTSHFEIVITFEHTIYGEKPGKILIRKRFYGRYSITWANKTN